MVGDIYARIFQIVLSSTIIFGLVNGSLIVAGIIIWFSGSVFAVWSIAGPVFILLGILGFIDDLVPFNIQPFITSEIAGIIAGSIASYYSFMLDFFISLAKNTAWPVGQLNRRVRSELA